jgi:hypothetical protein
MSLSLIESKLAQLRGHIRLMFLSYGLGLLLVWIAGLALWLFWSDYLLNLPAVVRVTFLVISCLVLVVVIIRNIIYPLSRTLTDEDLALLVEREYPLLNDRLITSLQFLKNQDRYKDVASARMIEAVVGESFDLAGKLQFGEAVRSRRLLYVVMASICAMCLVFAHAYFARDPMSTWARRVFGADVAWPTRTKLDVKFLEADQLALYPTDEDLTINFSHDPAADVYQVALDSDLRIIVEPSGDIPSKAEVRIDVFAAERDGKGGLVKKGLQSTIKRDMNREVIGAETKNERVYFSYNKLSAQNTWEEIYIKAGDALAGPYVVVVIPPPELSGPLELNYHYAEYLRLPDRSTQDRAIEGVAGTRVTMHFATTKPLAIEGTEGSRIIVDYNVGTSAPVRLEHDEKRDATEKENAAKNKAEQSAWHYSAIINLAMGMSRYTLKLVDEGGIANSKRLGDLMQVKEDIAPAVRVLFSGDPLVSNQLVAVSKDAVIPVEFELSDDYGVGQAKLFWRFAEEQEFREFKPFAEKYKLLRSKPATLVKDTWDLDFDALIRDANIPLLSPKPTIEAFIQAFDLRQGEIDPKTNQPTLQASQHNPIMSYELYTVDDLRAKVSTQIRQIKTTINAMLAAQVELVTQTSEALEKKDQLNLEGEEGRRLRTDLNNAFQRQNQLLRDAEAVMERFGVFAQAYQFSRLERDDKDRPQEGRIQAVRLLLAIAGADRELQQLLMTPLNQLKDAEGDALLGATDETIDALLKQLKRAKPDASFPTASFGMLLQESKVNTPGSAERARSLCENILSTTITPSERRELLAELKRQQLLNADTLKAIQALVKKWEGFDDILAGFRGLRDSQKDINDNLKDNAKGK